MSKTFKLRVKIVEIKETEEVSSSFKKREVIGVIEGEYPDYYKFEFVQDKTTVPDTLLEDTYATIFFNLRGKKVEARGDNDDKYFTSLQAWKVDTGAE